MQDGARECIPWRHRYCAAHAAAGVALRVRWRLPFGVASGAVVSSLSGLSESPSKKAEARQGCSLSTGGPAWLSLSLPDYSS